MTCSRCHDDERLAYSVWCAACCNESGRELYARNREERTRIAREQYAASDKKWAYNLQRNYGLSVDDYFALLASQGERCAICRDLPSGRITRLVVDHDHATGRVRGLLCTSCNHMLGNAKDDPCRLLAAADYVVARATVKDWSEGGPLGHRPRSQAVFAP